MMSYETNKVTELTDKQLDALLEAEGLQPLTDVAARRIQEKTLAGVHAETAQPKRRRHRRGALVAGVLVAAMALFGFTQRDRIAELYYSAFGNPNFAAYAETVNSVAEVDGFELKVLSALSDGDTTHFLVDIRDVSGQNRLSSSTHVSDWNLESAKVRGLAGGGCQVVAFDEATGTATLMVSAIGEYPDSDVIFHLRSFVTGVNEFEGERTGLNLYEMLQTPASFKKLDKFNGYGGGYGELAEADGFDLDRVESILTPNVDVPVLGTDRMRVVGVALDDAGFLHVVYTMPKAENDMEAYFLSLKHKETGEIVDCYYSISEGGGSINGVKTGERYDEYVFDMRGKTMEDIQNYELMYGGFYYDCSVEGDWSVKFTTPEALERLTLDGDTISINGRACRVTSLALTPLSLEVALASEDALPSDFTTSELDGALAVVHQDGTTTQVVNEGAFSRSTDDAGNQFISYRLYVLELQDVTALQIGNTVYPVK